MPVTLSKTSSTVCFRSRLVSARFREEESTTRHWPFSGSPTCSTVMSSSPDQSREKRTGTVRPWVSRSAVSWDTTAAKYQVELVMSFPTVPVGADGSWAMRLVSWEAVMVSRLSGVSRLS